MLVRMEREHESAIAKVVAHNGGPVALARELGENLAYQEVQRWVRRGWASPMHILRLKPLLPAQITVDDLFADRARIKQATREAA